jgi:hypothetical protein
MSGGRRMTACKIELSQARSFVHWSSARRPNHVEGGGANLTSKNQCHEISPEFRFFLDFLVVSINRQEGRL